MNNQEEKKKRGKQKNKRNKEKQYIYFIQVNDDALHWNHLELNEKRKFPILINIFLMSFAAWFTATKLIN